MSRSSVSNPRRKNKTRSRFGTVFSKCQATNQLSLMWIVNSAQGRVYAVVTGASKGIGADIAKQFAAEGAAVVVNYASSKEGADRVVDQIAKRGGRAVAVRANVARKADIEHLFAEAKKAFGKIDILVNNAGVYDWSPIEEITEEQFHKHFDVNVLGLLLATQEAVKQFDSTGGNIINISSTVTSLTPPGSSVYTCTKA